MASSISLANRLLRGCTAFILAASMSTIAPTAFAQEGGNAVLDKDSLSSASSVLSSQEAALLAIGAPTEAVTSAYWLWPIPGVGADHISQGVQEFPYRHDGMDIWGTKGTPIVASRDGYVSSDESTNTLDGYGICVVIYHGDGTSTYYAHLDSRIVSDGDWVSQGQVIGYMGNTGDSYGDHLHFEIRTDTSEDWIWGTPIDPEPFIVGHDSVPGEGSGDGESGDAGNAGSGDGNDGGVLENDYLDVDYNDPSCWYASCVKDAHDMGLMLGVGSGEYFMPLENVTRGQVITILWRSALGSAASGSETGYVVNSTPFVDNQSGQFYTAAINWAYANGIVSGSNGLVRPVDTVTRQELAVMMANYASYEQGGRPAQGSAAALSAFSDGQSIADWAASSVAWCAENGIMTGRVMDDGAVRFDPSGTATRAEMAKVSVTTSRLFA